MAETRHVLAVVDDLFFTVKIQDAARRSGLPVPFVQNAAQALARAAERPALIIFDLNASKIEPLKIVGELKRNPDTKDIPVLGYLSHVQTDLKRRAEEAGCDRVVARSVFSGRLPDLLRDGLLHAGE